jgi:hypothetical protein
MMIGAFLGIAAAFRALWRVARQAMKDDGDVR